MGNRRCVICFIASSRPSVLNNSQTSFSRFGVASSDKSHVADYGSLGVTPGIPDGEAMAWSDLRTLSDTQIRSLARNMVKEVKKRGPFPVSYTHLDVYKRQVFVRILMAQNMIGRSSQGGISSIPYQVIIRFRKAGPKRVLILCWIARSFKVLILKTCVSVSYTHLWRWLFCAFNSSTFC